MAINYLKSIDLIERTVTLLDGTLLPFGHVYSDDNGMTAEIEMPGGDLVLVALDVSDVQEITCH